MHGLVSTLCALTFLAGCSVGSEIQKNDERYLQPGALDAPLTGAYSVYSFKLLGRYQVTYQWVTTSGCGLRGVVLPPDPSRPKLTVYRVPDIFEEGGKTWQGSNFQKPPMDLDPWVTSVKAVSRALGREGQSVEVGMKLLCEEAWMTSNHYLWVRLRRASVDAVQQEVNAGTTGVPLAWTRQMRNGVEWRILKVPIDQLRSRRPNGVGGPYQTWIAPLGASGYSMAFTLGASEESLQYPQAHARFEATLAYLVNALKVEPLPR